VNDFYLWVDQTLTVGAEWNRDELDDPSSTGLSVNDNNIGGIPGSAADRSSKNHAAGAPGGQAVSGEFLIRRNTPFAAAG
jgi:outer membrane receptor for ferrienterochelin and colicin